MVAHVLEAELYLEYCDNEAVVAAIHADKARDARFQHALELRENVLNHRPLEVETHSIPTKENPNADDLSRGKEGIT